MKVRKVKIGIKSLEEILEGSKEAMKKLEKGEKVKRSRGVYFENLAAFRRALTEKRLEMLHVIKERKPSSIYILAKMLDRDMKNIMEDIGYLKEIGLVEIRKTKEKRARTIPSVDYDKIDLEIAI